MLTAAQRERVDIVLVSPRNPLNIGAAARAMANFGFTRLSVVAPHEPHWQEARSAIGASDVLQSARLCTTVAEAVAECTLVLGTGTLDRRKPEQSVVPLPELAPLVAQEITRSGRVAVIFGSEKRGLSREDLAYCHLLVEIPTDPHQPSMNLGQAVAVCLYELASRLPGRTSAAGRRPDEPAPDPSRLPASSGSLERLAEVAEKVMQAANYSPAEMREANRHDLRLLLRRLTLTEKDTRRVLGLFRRILWRLEHRSVPRKPGKVPHDE